MSFLRRLIKTKRRTLLLGYLILSSLAIIAYWYLSDDEAQPLFLDRTSFTVVLDDIPAEKSAALALGQDAIISHYSIPEEKFSRYFTLNSSSKTGFRWVLRYDAGGGRALTVYLAKRVSEQEAFGIAAAFITKGVGRDYFSTHFKRASFKDSTAHYTYAAAGTTIGMWVRLSYEREVSGHHVLLTPQEVKISREEAERVALENVVPAPMGVELIFDGSRLAWRCTWQHTPSQKDYAEERVYGVDVDATTGKVLRTHRYVKPRQPSGPVPVPRSQVDAMAQKVNEFKELADGAVINVRISKSQSEAFTIIKSFGRLVVKDGLSSDSDITIWIDREAFERAVKSPDPMAVLTRESRDGKVSVSEDKNPIALARKGYVSLYDKFKAK